MLPPLPNDDHAAILFLYDRLVEQDTAIFELSAGIREVTYVAPTKPRTGMIRFADGTRWNPGVGAGYYQYKGGAWVAL
jgi:hypothetical protein